MMPTAPRSKRDIRARKRANRREAHRKHDARFFDDPARALRVMELEAAANPHSAAHLPLTGRQEEALLMLLATRRIDPPRDPHSLTRLEATRWITALTQTGALP